MSGKVVAWSQEEAMLKSLALWLIKLGILLGVFAWLLSQVAQEIHRMTGAM